MKARWILPALVALALSAASVSAQLQPVQRRVPRPGSAALAATGNIIFMPLRLAFTTLGAGLGGLTGWLTAGNKGAANDIWGLFDGQGYLQPDMMYGEEPLEFGDLQFRLHVTKP